MLIAAASEWIPALQEPPERGADEAHRLLRATLLHLICPRLAGLMATMQLLDWHQGCLPEMLQAWPRHLQLPP